MSSNRVLGMWFICAAVTMTAANSTYAAGFPWARYAAKSDDWYRSADGRRVADNLLSQQSPLGSWPKNFDTSAKPYEGNPADIKGTFDNGATIGEIRFLARAYRATQEAKYRDAVLKGVDHILKAQYPNGGWPQSYPPGKGYARHITFNDNSMVNLMRLMREVATTDSFAFVDAPRRQAAQKAFDRGVDCILKCQIVVNGKKTAWCAQHDEIDFQPRPARTYELVSLSGGESVEIVRLLMSLEKPSPEVIAAIESAVKWFEEAKLTGIKQVFAPDPQAPRGRNKVVVKDPDAPPMWARFYEIGTNRPIFSDRDGVPKRELADIGYERRNGYSWLGTWPADLLAKEYPAWKAKWRASDGK
ncbi:MAG TPA: pectate lyase [Gemmataceae bacterium]|jgi:pectate lyase|nr:pectate lyase [Gemmataceae bacterium]